MYTTKQDFASQLSRHSKRIANYVPDSLRGLEIQEVYKKVKDPTFLTKLLVDIWDNIKHDSIQYEALETIEWVLFDTNYVSHNQISRSGIDEHGYFREERCYNDIRQFSRSNAYYDSYSLTVTNICTFKVNIGNEVINEDLIVSVSLDFKPMIRKSDLRTLIIPVIESLFFEEIPTLGDLQRITGVIFSQGSCTPKSNSSSIFYTTHPYVFKYLGTTLDDLIPYAEGPAIKTKGLTQSDSKSRRYEVLSAKEKIRYREELIPRILNNWRKEMSSQPPEYIPDALFNAVIQVQHNMEED